MERWSDMDCGDGGRGVKFTDQKDAKKCSKTLREWLWADRLTQLVAEKYVQ